MKDTLAGLLKETFGILCVLPCDKLFSRELIETTTCMTIGHKRRVCSLVYYDERLYQRNSCQDVNFHCVFFMTSSTLLLNCS